MSEGRKRLIEAAKEMNAMVKPRPAECEACGDTGFTVTYFACGTPWKSYCRCIAGREQRALSRPTRKDDRRG